MKDFLLNFMVLIVLPFLIHFLFHKKENKKMDYEALPFYLAVIDLLSFGISRYIVRQTFMMDTPKNTIISILIVTFVSILVELFFQKKLKSTYEILLKKSKKISLFKWECITFAFLFIAIIAVSPRILLEPYLMVEDGKVFLNQQFDKGLSAIFDSYGGYCILVSRLSAFLAAHIGKMTNSIVTTVNVLKWLTILVSVICVNYLNHDHFNWITKNRILRLFLSLLILFMLGNFQFLFYSTTSLHWFCGMLCFLVGVNLIHDKFPSYAYLSILGLCILSSPSSLVLGIAMLIYLIKKLDFKHFVKGTIHNIGTSNFIKMILMAICLAIQMVFILFLNKGEGGASNSLLGSLFHVFILTCNTPLFILGVSAATIFNDIYTSSLIGGILLLTLFLFIKNKQFFLYGVVSIFFLYFMTLYKNSDPAYYEYLFMARHWYYNAVPATIMFYLFLVGITQFIQSDKSYIIFIIYTLMFTFICSHLYYYNYDFCKNLKEIESQVDFNSTNYVNIEIFPGGDSWYLKVPVKQVEGGIE